MSTSELADPADHGGPAPWLQSYPSGIDWNADIPVESLSEGFERAVQRFAKLPCVDFLGKVYTYEEIGTLVDRAAGGLRALGVQPGDRVGLFLPNTPYFVIFYHAILKAGAVVVNFNPLYAEEEVRRQIGDAGVKVMVTLDLKALLPKISAVLGDAGLEKIVVCPMRAILPAAKSVLFALFKRAELAEVPKSDAYVAYADVIRHAGLGPPPEVDPTRDVAVLQYTGGTTGVPKGAMLTHANLTANRSQLRAWNPHVREFKEVIVGVLPLFHVFAMTVVMNLAISVGAKMVLLPRFELDQLLKTIDRTKPTMLPGVPSLYNVINQNPEKVRKVDFSAMRYCLSGGASLPREIKQAFEDIAGCALVEGYGLSESSPVVTCNPFDGGGKTGSIGLPLPRTRVEIRDPENPEQVMPLGERGEICICGPQVMRGYWNRPEDTQQTIFDGWLRTGDIGYMDSDGFVFLTDRIKDIILTNGYNVYPRVIEDAIYQHEGVGEVTVIAIPDSRRGQSAKAFIAPKAGTSLNGDDLRAFLKDKLSPIEMPAEFEFRDSLPKTMVGKLSKKELVEEERAKRGGGPPTN